LLGPEGHAGRRTPLSRKKQITAEAQTAARWLEVRIGELLGPGIQGQHIPSSDRDRMKIAEDDRTQFRLLAAHRDIVAEQVRWGWV
jgi:hypothetical protein